MISLNKKRAGDKPLYNVKLLKSIKNAIWLHTNKKEFLRKTSIINYLNELSNIKTTNQEIILAVKKCIKLLEAIMKEIDGYENIISNSQSNMSLNLNVSQDIKRLKGLIRPIDDNDEALKQLINAYSFDENDSLTNISQILLTNDNFTYLDLPAIPKHDLDNKNNNTANNLITSVIPAMDVETLSSNEIHFEANTVSDTGVLLFANPDLSYSKTLQKPLIENGFNELNKNVKPFLVQGNSGEELNSKIFNEFLKPSDASINVPSLANVHISSVDTSRQNDIPNVSREMYIDSGIGSSVFDDHNLNSKKRKVSCVEEESKAINTGECICEAEGNPFTNPELATRCLVELNSLINNFKECALRNIDQIVAEDKERNKVESRQKPVTINPFFIDKNNPILPIPMQSLEPKVTTPSNTSTYCDQLAFVYTKMYKELFPECDIEMLE